jgi:spore maturation protein CgeB
MHANKLTLGLLNQDNRDLQTSRSFEIPACGGFMVAERTEEHRMYFEEDKEAAYFGSFEELRDKLRFYAAHEEVRQRIALAGYRRCLTSPYRYVDRAVFALAQLGAEKSVVSAPGVLEHL